MKKILLVLPFLVACTSELSTFKKNPDAQIVYHNKALNVSSESSEFTHVASIVPNTVNGKVLQATGFAQNGSIAYVSYNTQGEDVRGGLDVIQINSLNQPVLLGSVVSEDSEFAQVKYKDGRIYLAGQKRGAERNYALLSIVKMNGNNPEVEKEIVFTDGYYATSLDIQGSTVYVSVPHSGVKVVDVSSPANAQVVTGYTASVPAGFVVTNQITSDWNAGYAYQLRIENVSGSNMTTGWTVCFNYNYNVGNSGISNADISSDSAKPNWKLTNKSYNKIIYNGSNVTINWNAFPGNLSGNKIQNVKLILQENADCHFSAPSSEFDYPLYLQRHNNKTVVVGGSSDHRVATVDSVVNVLATVSSVAQEAPARFAIKNNILVSNGGDTGLKIYQGIDSFNLSLIKSEPMSSRGNGVTFGDDKLMYLAQGEEGLLVVDMDSPSNPLLLGKFDFADDSGSANNVYYYKHDNKRHVFIADGKGGVKIVKVTTTNSAPQSCTISLLGLVCINL